MAGSVVRVDAGEWMGVEGSVRKKSGMRRSVIVAAVAGFLVAVFWWLVDVGLYLDRNASETTSRIVEIGRILTYPAWYFPAGMAILFVGPFLNALVYAGAVALVRSAWPAQPRV